MSPRTSGFPDTYVLIPINPIWSMEQHGDEGARWYMNVCYGIWVTLPIIIQPLFTWWIHIVSNSFLRTDSFSSRTTDKGMNSLILFPRARSYNSCKSHLGGGGGRKGGGVTPQRNADICRQKLHWRGICGSTVATDSQWVSLTERLGLWIMSAPCPSTPGHSPTHSPTK